MPWHALGRFPWRRRGAFLFLLPLAALLLPEAKGDPIPMEKPRGVFASAGSMEAEIVQHPQVRGNLIRVMWSQIEPTPGQFDFSTIERQIAPVEAAHKKWSLAVVAGPHSPAWLYLPPYGVEALDIRFRGAPVKVPKFWSPALQERLAALAAGLATKYKDDPALALVYLPQMSGNGVEGHFNGNPPETLANQGLTEDRWVDAVLQGAKTFAAAFPQKPVAIEMHDILGSAAADRRVMQAIEADPALLNQVGVALWWLSGRTDYQADLLAAFATFKGDLYAQLIDRASKTASFPATGYAQAFQQAKTLGVRYIEPWDVDVKSHAWDALLEDFNRYADQPPADRN